MKNTRTVLVAMAMLFVISAVNAQQPSVPRVPGTTSNTPTPNSAEVERNLDIINGAFDTYNTYGTKFSVKGNRIHWKSTVTEASADLNDLIFYVHYDNKWIVLKCLKDGCFEGTTFKDEYSMSLKTTSGNISPVMDDVLHAFNTIRKEVLSK